MARKKKEIITNKVEKIEKIIVEKISFNEYLSKYSRKRILDKVLQKWYFRKDPTKPKKTKDEWDNIIKEFRSETER